MMISPETYAHMLANKSYAELIKERDELIKSIRDFEKNGADKEAYMICPSPDVIYQVNLEYLAELCRLIREKYREEMEE
jgi:hypothetical protein